MSELQSFPSSFVCSCSFLRTCLLPIGVVFLCFVEHGSLVSSAGVFKMGFLKEHLSGYIDLHLPSQSTQHGSWLVHCVQSSSSPSQTKYAWIGCQDDKWTRFILNSAWEYATNSSLFMEPSKGILQNSFVIWFFHFRALCFQTNQFFWVSWIKASKSSFTSVTFRSSTGRSSSGLSSSMLFRTFGWHWWI